MAGTHTAPDGLVVLHADDDLVVIDKPAGLAVHRGHARDRDVAMTRVRDALGAYVYPVHRLDRGASGALVFALHAAAARALGDAFATGRIRKHYLALVRGVPRADPETAEAPEWAVIDHPIPRREDGPRVRAVTRYRVLATTAPGVPAGRGRYALVLASPETGRRHQIRRHFKHLSCPLLGDVKYGKGEHNRLMRERFGMYRLALHAAMLELPALPDLGRAEVTAVTAPLPADLASPLAALGLAPALDRVDARVYRER